MEKWKEVFIDIIPQDIYETKIINGEENGLVVELISDKNHVFLIFGFIYALRILDEGIVQSNLYSENEIKKYKLENFKNIIYEVKDGEFERQIRKITDNYWEALNAKHYVIITQNFNIDIITECEPEIKVS